MHFDQNHKLRSTEPQAAQYRQSGSKTSEVLSANYSQKSCALAYYLYSEAAAATAAAAAAAAAAATASAATAAAAAAAAAAASGASTAPPARQRHLY